ncbi:MAG: acyltransferase [Rhodocyclaceae bacterium]|nr:acyltransferase [Rhodocyclaceae bacterium]
MKAIASQVIVWHHIAYFGPMPETARALVPAIIDGLRAYGLLAVPIFLVTGGFLAARAISGAGARLALPVLIGRRYRRLAPPYLAALVAAVAGAWLARSVAPHPENPLAPGMAQIFAHVALLQDVLGYEALSAGIWYVAIDFQLFVLLAFLAWVSRAGTTGESRSSSRWVGLSLAVTLLSLFWLNLDPELEIWAPYFFGAYGFGILAERISRLDARGPAIAALAVLAGIALMVEWRPRILIAAATAVVLAWTGGRGPRQFETRPVSLLGDISYGLFLIHYPVALTVGAVVTALAPNDASSAVAGLMAAWLLSLAAGTALHRIIEVGLASPRRR